MNYSFVYFEGIEKIIETSCIKDLADSSIFITGGTGLICSTIADVIMYSNKKYKLNIKLYLGARSEKRTIERFSYFNEGNDYTFVQYDSTKEVKLNFLPDYIIHGASNAAPSNINKEPVETMTSNFIGLYNLFEFSRHNRIKKILYISSSEIYGNKTNDNAFIENDYGFLDILNPRASYPSSKRASETLCIAYYKEYGVFSVIVRPGHIYGPQYSDSDNRASTSFIRDVFMNKDILMNSDGIQLRSYCYSLDCASAILSVLKKGQVCEAYNISNSKSVVTIRQFAEEVAKLSGRKVITEYATENEKKKFNLMSNSSLASTKIEKLGWYGVFDLHDGVLHTLSVLGVKNA